MASPITQFELDPDLFAIISECTENYGVGDDSAEWPSNIISRQVVVYANGAIARKVEAPTFKVDPDELALCRQLADEALATMEERSVGMGSESDGTFRAFFVAGNIDDPRAIGITESLVRAKFGGTIFPLAPITIEPLAEAGTWWSEVVADAKGQEAEEYLRPWRAMMAWFKSRPEFVDTAFLRIGDIHALADLDEADYPPGTEMPGCVLPRAALGLTKGGSLAGIFGVSVQT